MNYLKIKKITDSLNIKKKIFGCDTSRFCSIGAGGRVSALVTVETADEMIALMTRLEEEGIKSVMIGGGTNIVFSRDHSDLVVIKPGKVMGKIEITGGGCRIKAGASASVPLLVKKAAVAGLDLEFLAGIPGTVGGAVSGNSGSADRWICDIVSELEYIKRHKGGFELAECRGEDIVSGYRSFDVPGLEAVLSVVLKPDKADSPEGLSLRIRENIYGRKKKQPLGVRTCGCFFKNPSGRKEPAGVIIESCGLKGLSYGGARVSPVHANFIENYKNATPEDIVVLSKIIIDKIREKYGLSLEYEVKIIG